VSIAHHHGVSISSILSGNARPTLLLTVMNGDFKNNYGELENNAKGAKNYYPQMNANKN
jgi:hypothetical protein